MSIKLTCDCGRTMEVRDKYAGRRAKCPACGKIVAIPGEPEPAYDVILSYSAEDKPTADAACATLEARGIRCWIAPRDILPGQEWGEAIIDAISECGLMVLIFSSHANNSPQVRREAERAVSKGKPIIPLRIEDVTPCKTMEYFLSTPHWLDALTPPLEQHLVHLAETVEILLKREAGRVPRRPAGAARPAAPRAAGMDRKRLALWIGGGAAALAVVAVIAVVVSMLVSGGLRAPVPPERPSPQPVTPAPLSPAVPPELIQAKATAETARERVKGLDRGQGLGALIDAAETQCQAGEAFLTQKAHAEALAAYKAAAAKFQAAVHADKQRQEAAHAQAEAVDARAQDVADAARVDAEEERPEELMVLQIEAAVAEAEAWRFFDVENDFVQAKARWQAAAAGYRKYGEALVSAAQAALEREIDGYDVQELQAKGGDAWKQVSGLVVAAKKSANEGRFAEAAGKYDQARQLLPGATPLAAKLQKREPKINLLEVELRDVLQFFQDGTGVPILVNWGALEGALIGPTTPVTLEVSDVSTARMLDMILEGLLTAGIAKPAWFVRKGRVVLVSTEDHILALRRMEEAGAARRRMSKTGPLYAKMKTRLQNPLEFYDIALGDVVTYLSEASKVNMIVRWQPLEAAGITKDTEVSVPKAALTAEEALWAVLAVLPAFGTDLPDYAVVDDEYVIISTAEDLNALPPKP